MSLAGIATSKGRFCVLAVDHRDSLRAFMSPSDPSIVGDEEMVELKIELVRNVAPLASGVMLDPELSIPQVIEAGALPDGVGFTAALEAQGYLGDPEAGPTRIHDGWSVEAAAASGATAAKLLVPYHPHSALATQQEAVAVEVIEECRRVGIPLVLEPLSYGLADSAARPNVVHETVARFARLGPDLLKAPFPIDPSAEPDHWLAACSRITEICPMPWVLLSGGGCFETFRDQLAVALEAGCAGFMVGRALWGEAAQASGKQRSRIIDETVLPRFEVLRSLVL